MSADKYLSIFFAPNGGYCLYIRGTQVLYFSTTLFARLALREPLHLSLSENLLEHGLFQSGYNKFFCMTVRLLQQG